MALTGDKIYARCVVTPIETCDEGFEHIQSDIAKRLGGNCNYSLVDELVGDTFYYDSATAVSTSVGDLISGTYTSGANVSTSDIIFFLYVKNSNTQEVVLSLDGSLSPAAAQDSIKLRQGQTVMVPLNSTLVSDLHVYATAATTVEVFAVIEDVA